MKRKRILALVLVAVAVLGVYFVLGNYFDQASRQGIVVTNLAPSAHAGYVPGEFSVGESGTPHYNIPIDVPVGTNQVQPSLGLTYANVRTNGLLGVGWNLTGLSAITRVGKIIPQDAIKGGVNLDSDDRFAINGQRLIAYRDKAGVLLTTVVARDSAYGKDGTEYRTEVESWVKVYSWGNCGKGPCSFTSTTKDGSSMSFAQTADSRIQPKGSRVVMMWAVNKVSEKNGDYVLVSYNQDSLSGSYFPNQILYTGNERGGLVPQRMVEFVTENRNDTLVNFTAGVMTSCPARIKSINTYVDLDGDGENIRVNNNLVKKYSIAYSYSGSTGRSIVDSVTVFDQRGASLPHTQFTWSAIDTSQCFADTLTVLPDVFRRVLSSDVGKLKADFNGDGRADIALLQANASTITVLLTNRSFSFTATQNAVPSGFGAYMNQPDVQTLAGDFNGDGLTDIAFFKNRASNVPILFSLGKGGFYGKMIPLVSNFQTDFNSFEVTKSLGDFNGDGISDVAGFRDGYKNIPLLLSVPGGGFNCVLAPIPSQVSSFINSPGATHALCDLDGDGLTDIAAFNQGYQSVPILMSVGNGTFSSTLQKLPGNVSAFINAPGTQRVGGDFNGDGLSDFVVFGKGFNSIPIIYSRGDGTFNGGRIPLTKAGATLFNGTGSDVVTGDLNGDGVTDLAAFREGATSVATLFSNGSRLYNFKIIPINDRVSQFMNAQGAERFVSDFNGDGLVDIGAIKEGFSSLPILVANKIRTKNSLPDLMLKVTDGIGGITEIEYDLSEDVSTLKADTSIHYPLMSIRFPQFVVSRSEAKGVGTASVISQQYSYEAPIIDNYRGWMGFKRSIIVDAQNHTRVVSHHLAQFPFMGIVQRQEMTDGSDLAEYLSKISYNYESSRDSVTGVFRVWNSSYRIDHYTNGNYNFSKKKDFVYDKDRKVVIRIHDFADLASDADDFYTGYLYGNYDQQQSNWWKTFFPTAERYYVDSLDRDNWEAWTKSDLLWKRYGYDSSMNMNTQSSYVDNDGEKQINAWAGFTSVYDCFGNNVSQSFPSNYFTDSITSTTQYDGIFRTFPILATSPVPTPGVPGAQSLQTSYAYDPRFALKVMETDANGNTVYMIADDGVDGFGRAIVIQGTEAAQNKLSIKTVYEYKQGDASGYSVSEYRPVSLTQSSVPDTTWLWQRQSYDGMGREVKTESNAYNSKTTLVTLTGYNLKGELEKQFMPFYYSARNGVHYQQAGATGDSLFVLQKYGRHGKLKSLWSPAAQAGQSAFLLKEYKYDTTDNRIIYTREPSPQNDSIFIRWKKVFNSNGKVRVKQGPYNDDGSEAVNFSSVTYQYDQLSRLIRIIDPLNESTIYKYNSVGHVISEYRPETDTLKTVFNSNDWPVSNINPNGRINLIYDDLGRVIQKIVNTRNFPADTTHYVYDMVSISPNSKGRLSRIILPSGTYTYAYNKTGMPSQKSVYVKALGNTFINTLFYDAAGRLISSVLPDSSTTDYVYNQGNNLAFVCSAGDTLARYGNYNTFDSYQNISYLNDVNSQLKYDNLGRLIFSTTTKGSYTHRKFDYQWTKANKLKSISDQREAKDPDFSQHFTYYPSGRLLTAAGPYPTESYEYDPAGNRTADSHSRFTYSPTKKHELVGIAQSPSANYNLEYDNVGNLSKKSRAMIASSKGKSLKTQAAPPANPTFKYQFDAEGNLRSVKGDSLTLNVFSYNDQGERIEKKDSDNTETFYISPSYEVVKLPSGEFIHTRYVWDLQNVIHSRTVSERGVSLVKNGDRLLTSQATFPRLFHYLLSWVNAEILQVCFIFLSFTIILLWCAYTSVTRLRILASGAFGFWRRNTSANVVDRMGASISRRWMTGALMWASMVLLVQPAYADMPPGANGGGVPEAGEVRFFHHDHLGSSALLTDATGALTNNIFYAPYGGIDQANSSGKDNFRAKFTGKEKDENINLYYFGKRYYDAGVGRFVSPDPAGQYFSPYIYGNDDPLSGIDPDGEEFAFVIALIVAAIVGAYLGASIANGSFNPASWEWSSAKTWVGMLTGAAAGVAIVASGGAVLSAFGVVAAESVSLGSISASTLAFTSADVAFLASDSYAFSKEQSVSNAIFLGLDIIPFAGALLGRGVHAVRALTRTEDAVMREAESVAHAEAESTSYGACVLSFGASTQVKTPGGSKSINELKVGDDVIAYDSTKNMTGTFAVSRLFKRVATGLVLLITSCNDTIAVTPEHPFYLQEQGWVEAGLLKKDDRLMNFSFLQSAYASTSRNPTHSYEYVKDVIHMPDTLVQVYNVEVEGVHNYFVSGAEVLVHNARGCIQRSAAARQRGPQSRYGRNLRRAQLGLLPNPPNIILDGPRNTHVYLGYMRGEIHYVGITRQSVAARQAQHGARFTIRRISQGLLTNRQARSLEQFFINRYPGMQNIARSVSRRNGWYTQGQIWAEQYARATNAIN